MNVVTEVMEQSLLKKNFNLSSPTEFYLYQLALDQTSKREKIVKVISSSHNQIKNQKNLKDSMSSLNGNDFDEEGTNMVPFTYEHDGITIKFCCKPCLPKFKKNPSKYLNMYENRTIFN